MLWNGKELKTIGDHMAALTELLKSQDKKVAAEFMTEGRKQGEHWDCNIGYLTGYFTESERIILLELLGTSHPIFGTGTVTPEQAFKAGLELGQKYK